MHDNRPSPWLRWSRAGAELVVQGSPPFCAPALVLVVRRRDWSSSASPAAELAIAAAPRWHRCHRWSRAELCPFRRGGSGHTGSLRLSLLFYLKSFYLFNRTTVSDSFLSFCRFQQGDDGAVRCCSSLRPASAAAVLLSSGLQP